MSLAISLFRKATSVSPSTTTKSGFERDDNGRGKWLTIDNVPKVGVTKQVDHQTFHLFDTLNEVDDHFFGGSLVQGSNDVVDGLSKDRRQTIAHCGMSEGILMVPQKRRPGQVLRRWATTSEGVETCVTESSD